MANGYPRKAEKIVREAAVTNGVEFPEHIFTEPAPNSYTGNDTKPQEKLQEAQVETSPARKRLTSGHSGCCIKMNPRTKDCDEYAVDGEGLSNTMTNFQEESDADKGHQQSQQHNPTATQYSCLDLLKSRKMMFNSFLMCSLW